MRARVYVSMKPTVLDPQGQTICSALNGMGHKEIASVRQGKYFEIGVASGAERDSATRMLDEIARDVLSNPVIEDYRVEILDDGDDSYQPLTISDQVTLRADG
ncbi:MAG: phosphoribosylformylglycinamidine synthase subunit PurS [Acidobacteriaceae bacterium]|nr:phosphoribosylformylglycinamidine synthase subunit PurS [Acidobacteriaceae bacterium]MBV8572986.1 phosphoribosylformylglycinamidine synthase subunit PurS [Acidobacteriaceae bacterium]